MRLAICAFAALLSGKASEKNITISVCTDGLDGVKWFHDSRSIQKVLYEILANAIKFSDHGTIEVTAIIDEDSTLEFQVKDAGPGMAKEDQDKVFNLFSQADSSFTRKHGGMGLGLSICQKLVGLWGGSIGLESVQGQGSEFRFTVPKIARSESQSEPRQTSCLSVVK